MKNQSFQELIFARQTFFSGIYDLIAGFLKVDFKYTLQVVPSKHLLVLKTSWRHLQHVFSINIFGPPRRLEDILKTSWKTKNCYAEDILKMSWKQVLKMSWKYVLKTCLEDVLKTCLENIFKTSWRQKKMGISVSHKSKCVCIWQVYISQIYICRIQGESKIIN